MWVKLSPVHVCPETMSSRSVINGEDVVERLFTRKLSSVPHWLHFWMTGGKQFVLFIFHSVAVCETHMTKQGCSGAAERLPNFICLLCA